MPAFTQNRNLYLPGGGSLGIGGADEVADIDKINQNFQELDTWSGEVDGKFGSLDNQGYYVGTDAERVALAPPKLRRGIQWFSSDTGVLWRRATSSWEPVMQSGVLSNVSIGTTRSTHRIPFPIPFAAPPRLMVSSYVSPANQLVVATPSSNATTETEGAFLAVSSSGTSTSSGITWIAYGIAE